VTISEKVSGYLLFFFFRGLASFSSAIGFSEMTLSGPFPAKNYVSCSSLLGLMAVIVGSL